MSRSAPPLVAGIDEAGRGPLAGPVVAAAVILDSRRPIAGLDDSKKLKPSLRTALADEIRCDAIAWSVAWADPREIDRLNILHATMLAMRRAILGLAVPPQSVVVDGNRLPNLEFHGGPVGGSAVIGGDALVESISAASILAKVARDAMMGRADRLHPGYGFAGHKGYGTAAHLECLGRLGPCPEHRRSFRPVREADNGPSAAPPSSQPASPQAAPQTG